MFLKGRLVDRGAVIPKPSSSGPKRTYGASEPLYSIYYKLRRERDASGRGRGKGSDLDAVAADRLYLDFEMAEGP